MLGRLFVRDWWHVNFCLGNGTNTSGGNEQLNCSADVSEMVVHCAWRRLTGRGMWQKLCTDSVTVHTRWIQPTCQGS